MGAGEVPNHGYRSVQAALVNLVGNVWVEHGQQGATIVCTICASAGPSWK